MECASGNGFFVAAKTPFVDKGGVSCVGCERDAWPCVAIRSSCLLWPECVEPEIELGPSVTTVTPD